MNTTNLLLGATGLLLVVALVVSIQGMGKDQDKNTTEIERLRRDIAQLELSKTQFEQSRNSAPSLIFTADQSVSGQTPPPTKPANEDELRALRAQVEALTERAQTVEEPVAPTPIVEAPVEDELPVVSLDTSAEDEKIARRSRLIRDAILQATILEYSPEDFIAVADPTPSSTFNVGDELALRRNDGILCRFTVSRQVEQAFIIDLMATEAPEIVPGDELIIPPAFDGKLD